MKKLVLFIIISFQLVGIRSQDIDKLSYVDLLSLLDKDGGKLSTLPANYKSDKKCIAVAITNCPDAFLGISPELKNNRSFVYDLLYKNGLVLKHLSEEFKNDK